VEEPDESFFVTLANPGEGTILADKATITIADDDGSTGTGGNGGNGGNSGGGGAFGGELLIGLAALRPLLRRRRAC
jgi:hypothetical protein